MERGEPSWQTSSTSPMSMPSSSEAVATITLRSRLEPLLGVEAGLLRQRAMMSRDVLLAQPLGQLARHALHHAARVGEDQRGVVLLDELRDLVVHRAPDVAGHHRLERRRRHHQVDVALAHMAGVDDGDILIC